MVVCANQQPASQAAVQISKCAVVAYQEYYYYSMLALRGWYMRNIAKCFIVLCRIVLSFRPLAHVKSSGVRLYFIDNINCPNVIITFYVICGESVNQSLMAPQENRSMLHIG